MGSGNREQARLGQEPQGPESLSRDRGQQVLSPGALCSHPRRLVYGGSEMGADVVPYSCWLVVCAGSTLSRVGHIATFPPPGVNVAAHFACPSPPAGKTTQAKSLRSFECGSVPRGYAFE